MTPVSIQTNFGDKLIVDPNGARIQLWLNNQLILTKIERGDGKVGSTHPCTPIFGPDRNNLYGLSQHGNMRNELVEIPKHSENKIRLKYLINEADYPKGLEVIQTLTLDENLFKLEMTHTNHGDTPMALNSGEHCYFDAPNGFEGTKVNNLELTSIIKDNKDGVAIKLNSKNIIKIPGKNEIKLDQNGFNFAMIWVGTTPDLTTKDKNYICIEPVEMDPNSDFFGSIESLIQRGEKRTSWFSLSL